MKQANKGEIRIRISAQDETSKKELIPVQSKEIVREAREFCKAIVEIRIETSEEYENACELTKQVQHHTKRIETERKAITKPLGDQVTSINGYFRAAQVPLDNLKSNLRKSLAHYNKEQERKRLEIKRKAEAEAEKERLRLEKQAKKDADKSQEFAEKGNEDKAQEYHDKAQIKQELAESVEPPEIPEKVPKVKGVHYREVWTATVVDKRAFVAHCLEIGKLEYIKIDMKLLNGLAKEIRNNQTDAIPGIIFDCEKIPIIGG